MDAGRQARVPVLGNSSTATQLLATRAGNLVA
jgi:hypothetical protein